MGALLEDQILKSPRNTKSPQLNCRTLLYVKYCRQQKITACPSSICIICILITDPGAWILFLAALCRLSPQLSSEAWGHPRGTPETGQIRGFQYGNGYIASLQARGMYDNETFTPNRQ
jgi:hypothetical protein